MKSRREHWSALSKFLIPSCEGIGIADEGEIKFNEDLNCMSIADTRIKIFLVEGEGRKLYWKINHYFDVVDVMSGDYREVVEVVDTLRVGEESVVVKKVLMKIVESIVDSIIDEMS